MRAVLDAVVAVVALVALAIAVLSGSPIGAEPVGSVDRAVQLAHQFCGVKAGSEIRWRCKIGPLVDSTTPFLDRITDRHRVWQVTFRDAALIRPEHVRDTITALRDIDVFLDSTSGHLVKIEFAHGAIDREELPDISAAEAERQLTTHTIPSFGEQLQGPPETMPVHSFLEALSAGRVDPVRIKRVVGQYFVFVQMAGTPGKPGEYRYATPRHVWVLYCEGIPPVEPIGPPPPPGGWGDGDGPPYFGIPIHQLNRMSQIVNATTGRLLETMMTPSAPLRPEDRSWPSTGEQKFEGVGRHDTGREK
jgi:hypothetical protein